MGSEMCIRDSHEVDDLEGLAHVTRVRFGAIGSVAVRDDSTVHGPMALQ